MYLLNMLTAIQSHNKNKKIQKIVIAFSYRKLPGLAECFTPFDFSSKSKWKLQKMFLFIVWFSLSWQNYKKHYRKICTEELLPVRCFIKIQRNNSKKKLVTNNLFTKWIQIYLHEI